jgi:hypothetical protein
VDFVFCLETFVITGIHFIKQSKNEKFWGQQLDACPLELPKVLKFHGNTTLLFEIACQNLI